MSITTNIAKKTSGLGRKGSALAGLALFVGLWQGVCLLGVWPEHLLPSPYSTLVAIAELHAEGRLLPYIGTSLGRFAAGYLLAAALAVPLGLLLGWFAGARRMAYPVLQLLRPISPTAWFPFIVLWFGIGDAPAVAIIALAAFFPILFSSMSAIGHIDPTLLRVARNYGLSRLQFFGQIAVPASFPGIMVGMHLAIGTAWIFLVSGEMVGAQAGLGYLIVDARNNLRTDMVMAGILLIGLTGWALDGGMKCLEKAIGKRWGN